MNHKSDFALFLLRELEARGIPANKIVVQKATYFLQATGAPSLFQFRPHTYGPYSPDLADVLSDLCFWDKLTLRGSSYEIISSNESSALPLALQRFIKKQLDNFARVLNNNYSFENVEVMGTTLHCIRATWKSHNPPTLGEIFTAFSSWKGEKYQKSIVQESYEHLIVLLQNNATHADNTQSSEHD